jgi:hypothetical protein
MSDVRDEIERENEELREVDESTSEDVLSDTDQPSVGPISGDEAIDDDTPYKHTPLSPTTR